jgi:tRNA 5-methylaminomethyl-2-thiouridine biosynthesis bifunctional protein
MGRVSFRATTPDHLPLVGALPDWTTQTTGDTRLKTFPRQPGLYGLLGLGSRGLVWSALLAEHLACQINGEALPLEGDQADAIDPARFALRMRRHSR